MAIACFGLLLISPPLYISKSEKFVGLSCVFKSSYMSSPPMKFFYPDPVKNDVVFLLQNFPDMGLVILDLLGSRLLGVFWWGRDHSTKHPRFGTPDFLKVELCKVPGFTSKAKIARCRPSVF